MSLVDLAFPLQISGKDCSSSLGYDGASENNLPLSSIYL